jgi:DivIVA domain-containing protein
VLTLAGYGLLAIVIMVVLYVVAAKVLPAGEQIAPAVRDDAPWALPATRELTASDVAEVRLPVALRGYRFAETDLLLDRLGDELRARDAEIARLRAELAGPAPSAALQPQPQPQGVNPYSEQSYAAESEPGESEPGESEPAGDGSSDLEREAPREAVDAEPDER